ncbi:DoxX-like family protein [Streptoalloteichus tenebrarius]|uniref:DoxX-like family protein n=1 Tax=Streptoalloteichus tenebrarius (strain ATCC 17920 / DSM 40477 / JCM 4838 / CBS 697.72 / NBRC 16177 / NCIMB 11028 / NRRL B-12390 / A12253. 1 / ISP 5477) TaxID=1933 RepID=A0ABT1HZL9_STRSD|nr:DoxX family protein [Streptoalloteichus tenebrarius]MCP2260965.1 DoxX-like family protein [Streptoalloteichus tenebrarius]BFE98903.1 DoxX family protein [Streptoalloteichus tenebrarius]
MHIAYVVVIVLTVLINAGMAVADFARSRFVLANSAEVGVPVSWIPLLATLKMAGAVGLLLGLAGFRLLGVAAATGLVLFYVGALVAHVRARVFYNIAFPGFYFAFAVGSLVLSVL